MRLADSVVFVTGANRGIGRAFAQAALARGARKVYAGVRDPAALDLPGVIPVRLDVTQPEEVAAAARACRDVDILVNNAGIAQFGGFLAADAAQSARRQFETNFFGILNLAQAFAPVLAANGGGMLNVLSIASWINRPLLGVYGASKSAAWALTNGLRHELRAQGTQVTGLHMGFVDTDLTQGIAAPKLDASELVRIALDGFEAGDEEVLADERTQQVKRGLVAQPPVYLRAD